MPGTTEVFGHKAWLVWRLNLISTQTNAIQAATSWPVKNGARGETGPFRLGILPQKPWPRTRRYSKGQTAWSRAHVLKSWLMPTFSLTATTTLALGRWKCKAAVGLLRKPDWVTHVSWCRKGNKRQFFTYTRLWGQESLQGPMVLDR